MLEKSHAVSKIAQLNRSRDFGVRFVFALLLIFPVTASSSNPSSSSNSRIDRLLCFAKFSRSLPSSASENKIGP
jgi:hypothetical protein